MDKKEPFGAGNITAINTIQEVAGESDNSEYERIMEESPTKLDMRKSKTSGGKPKKDET